MYGTPTIASLTSAAFELVMTIAPPLRWVLAFITRAASRTVWNTPVRLMPTIASQSSRER